MKRRYVRRGGQMEPRALQFGLGLGLGLARWSHVRSNLGLRFWGFDFGASIWGFNLGLQFNLGVNLGGQFGASIWGVNLGLQFGASTSRPPHVHKISEVRKTSPACLPATSRKPLARKSSEQINA